VSWIKVRSELPEDPRVLSMADALKAKESQIVGACVTLWCYADTHTTNGKLAGFTGARIDRLVDLEGFAEALTKVKPEPWLEIDESDGSVRLPRFHKHNGSTAKSRALTARRVAKHRNRSSNAGGNAGSNARRAPRAEQQQSREEERRFSGSGAAGAPPPGVPPGGVRSAAAAPPLSDWADVAKLLRSVWPRGDKADEIAVLANATPERVSWLIWRSRTDKPPVRRRQGFIEKGIREGWPVDPAYLAKYHAELERLHGQGAAR
jgi:hypothetical protein